MQEFKVQTSLYDATEGRNGGGNINAVLKSGTPQWHGSAFEFFRNDLFNANEYFQEREGQPRPDREAESFRRQPRWSRGPRCQRRLPVRQLPGYAPEERTFSGDDHQYRVPVLPSDRSAASLSMAGFGNAFTPIDPVVLALLNVKSNQFGGAGGGWLIPSLPPSNPANPAAGAAFNLSTSGQIQ